MYPVMLNTASLSLALIGRGAPMFRRLQQLKEANSGDIRVYSLDDPAGADEHVAVTWHKRLPTEDEFADLQLVMIVELEKDEFEPLVKMARKHRVWVHVEDDVPYCDIFCMSQVRRGDLVFGISTSGKSPALGIMLREWLEKRFDTSWGDKLNQISDLRNEWKKQGDMASVLQKSKAWVQAQGWLRG